MNFSEYAVAIARIKAGLPQEFQGFVESVACDYGTCAEHTTVIATNIANKLQTAVESYTRRITREMR